MKTLVLGLGNTILRDDGAGIFVVRELAPRLAGAADCAEGVWGGLELVERLRGYERVIIVDSILLEGEEPGTVFRLRPDDFSITARLASLHDVDIVTALELGRRLGFAMPRETAIYAVQAADTRTFGEGCTDAVARVLPALADEIEREVRGRSGERISRALGERSGRA